MCWGYENRKEYLQIEVYGVGEIRSVFEEQSTSWGDCLDTPPNDIKKVIDELLKHTSREIPSNYNFTYTSTPIALNPNGILNFYYNDEGGWES